MSSAAPTTAQPPNAPQPNIPGATPASPPNKRDLRSWWKTFALPKQKGNENVNPKGIFGVPLRQSITYANVAISLVDEHGESYIYGYVPIVVAKCGVFLKERATTTEGIFRLSGSEKRIKELKNQFDSPDRYGKGLSWEGYTVHDAANVFRRYLNDLPEPVVPLDLYEKFREPLRGATKQAVGDTDGPQFVENFDETAAIIKYQKLITELPPLNKQLLLYILDLLAVFAAKSDENRMTSQNLAAIFQPGMLSHPNHAMAPEEYRLNQCVIIFLIENQDHFLIGMKGTGTDEETRQIVASGAAAAAAAAPVTPTLKTSGVARSSSNASAGAHSVRREGQIRRNRSVNSRHSRQGDSAGPNSPALSTTNTGGLGRSNTVPSKRSPAVGGGKFRKQDHSGPHSPAHLEALTPVQPTETPRVSEQSSLAPQFGAASVSAGAGRSQERLLDVPQDQLTPRKERQSPGLFNRSPADDGKRQPNKLQKKRLPGSMNYSAHSSNASLPQSGNVISPNAEPTNPLDQPGPVSEAEKQQALDGSSDPTPRASQVPQTSGLHPDSQLKSQKSPPTSLHSSYQEGSDPEQAAENPNGSSSFEKERKSKWRISRSARRDDDPSIRSNENLGASQTSFTSGSAGKPRKSFTGEHSDTGIATTDTHHSNSTDKEESRGPIKWIRNKVREAKERNKSPPPSDPGHASLAMRGKSLDIKRDQPAEKPKEPVPVAWKPAEIATEKPQETIAEEPQAPVVEEKQPEPTAQPLPTEAPVAKEPPTLQPEPTAKLTDVPEEQPVVPTAAEPQQPPPVSSEPQPPVSTEHQPEVKPEPVPEAKGETQPEAPKQA